MTLANNKTHPSLAGTRVGLNPIEEEGVMPVSHDINWDEKVQRGRALVTEINDRKWELGDLANEVAPASTVGVSNDGLVQRFADEIGVSANTLREYRRVSAAWANATRVAFQTWTTHRMLAEREDRFAIIAEQTWTYNSLSERLGRLPNPSRISDAQQAGFDAGQTADEIEADAMVEAIRTNPEIALAAARALTHADPVAKQEAHRRLAHDADVAEKPKVDDDWADRAKASEERELRDRLSRGGLRYASADGYLVAAKQRIKNAISEIHEADLEDEHRDLLRDRVVEIERLVSMMRNEIDGNVAVDWDAEMASLMGGE